MSVFSRLKNSNFLAKRARVAKFNTPSNLLFTKYLVITNVTIATCMSATGDFIQQMYEVFRGYQLKWKETRTLTMAIAGMPIGLFCHYWYRYLDATFVQRTASVILKKFLVDQLFAQPLIIVIFFSVLGLLCKHSAKQISNDIAVKGKDLYIAEWIVQPPAQFVNFCLLPPHLRVAYLSTIWLMFDVYFSYVANKDKRHQDFKEH